MTDAPQLTEDQAVEKIQKLLNLAAKNSNEAEASAAAAKAQELMERFNLTSAAVERESGKTGKRGEELVEGGFYRYQQELWGSVAELHFCLYWSQKYRREDGKDRYGRVALRGRRHRLIGRLVNVRMAQGMAQYLEATIERLSRERFPDRRIDNFVMSYKQGMAYRLCQRLRERRAASEREEMEKARVAEERAARAGVSTSTALTLASYAKSEHDKNVDHMYGEGTSATWAAERTARAAKRRAEEEAYTKWAATHPEEARKKEEARQRKEARSDRADSRKRWGNVDDGAFWAGADAAEKISLDQQATARGDAGRIGR